MPVRSLAVFILTALILSAPPAGARRSELPPGREARRSVAPVPAPEEVLGFRPGDDRKLASWASVVAYFKRLDAASDRVRFEELGKSTMGAPFVMATVSAPENLRRLEEFKDIQRRLADPRSLGRDADRKARRLAARGKTVVLITCGIHSTEVGSYLSSVLIAHRLASSDEPEVRDILRETIVLLVPSLNPDGVDIVKDWYDKTLGTPYEGTEPPALYHKYTGHDNNRDWYAFTQRETQLAVEKIHQVWRPQIVHDIHQMGREGARLFLPPYVEPVEPNVPKQIVEGYTELGHAVAAEVRGRGFKGVVTDAIFDAWTPARAYSHYHGGVRILSETASAKIATPVSVRFEDLRPGRGYDPRKVSANFPGLWPGGGWHLRDVTDYMTAAAFALMKHAARNRERWLTRFYEIGKEAVRPRKEGELFAFLLPPLKEGEECDDPFTHIFWRGGVEWDVTRRFTRGGVTYPQGTRVVRMDQPYGAFAKALLEAQKYPDLRDKDGRPVAPYDVTAHTLPLLMNVEARAVSAPFKYPRLRSSGGSSCAKAGCRILPGAAVYKSHVPSMDAGWTQWVFEQKDWIVPAVTDERIRSGDLFAAGQGFTPRKYKAIVIPDQNPAAILNGHKPGTMPEEYTGGLGAQGVKNLREFVEAGGTLVFLNRASRFAVEQFDLPVRDVTENLKRTEFYAPGSILRVRLDTSHPIARGMPEASIAWAEDSPAFEIKGDPGAAARVRVIARYPQDSDPLLSGWLLGGDRLRGKAALVEVRLGKGRIYLFGFRPQYRGQSLATYPLFLNSVAQRAGN